MYWGYFYILSLRLFLVLYYFFNERNNEGIMMKMKVRFILVVLMDCLFLFKVVVI